jgi:hypothetical protein
MTLGELKRALERKNQSAPCVYDFGYFVPKDIGSWRGDYRYIAIGYERGGSPTVADTLKLVSDAIGQEFTGYKGGEFYMDESTRVYVSNNGEACHTAIIDVLEVEYSVILATEYHAYIG